MSGDEYIVGYDANSDNGFIVEEDTSSVDAYDGNACLSDNFSEEEEEKSTSPSLDGEEEENEIIYKNSKLKFSVIKKTHPSYIIILQEEDDFI